MARLGGSQALDFTDGDTYKRFTVIEPDIRSFDEIICAVRRPQLADPDDAGWSYVENVIQVRDGSFDVTVAAFALGDDSLNADGPAETVTLIYRVF